MWITISHNKDPYKLNSQDSIWKAEFFVFRWQLLVWTQGFFQDGFFWLAIWCWFFMLTLRIKKKNSKKNLRTPTILVLLVQLGILRVPGFFLNTFSKTLQPRFYELRKIWDMTLTWIFSDFKKMFRWNVSQTCDFPILLEQQILFGTTKYPSKKKKPSTSKKNTIFPKKNFIPSFIVFVFLFILLGFLVNFLFI